MGRVILLMWFKLSGSILSASRLVVWALTSVSLRDYPNLDGDASETQRVYTGSGRECPTSSVAMDSV